MNKYAIIVAGGKGLRMGADIPKQFLLLNTRPILMHTLQAFADFDQEMKLILVLPKAHFEYWNQLCKEYQFDLNYQLVEGGVTRFHSVWNGLQQIDDAAALVAVHDGVRPCVGADLLTRAYNGAEEHGNAVCVVALKDSIRNIGEDGISKSVDRSQYKLVQTPQIFNYAQLKESYEWALKNDVSHQMTDDASVVEYGGGIIHLVEGSYQNIKITTPEDMSFAKAYFNS